MSLSKPGVDLLPVEMFLVDDSLDALWHDAVLERQVLDLGARKVRPVDLFFDLR